jgi:hypothetical protein
LGADEFDGAKVVEGEAVLTHQPAKPTAQGQSCYSRTGHYAARDGQTMQLCLAVELAPRHAALSAHRPVAGIDMDALHRGEIDHYSAIDGGSACHVVASATNGDFEAELLGKFDGIDYVRHALASGHQGRALVDEAIMYLSRILVLCIGRCQQLSGKAVGKLRGGFGQRNYGGHDALSQFFVPQYLSTRPRQVQARRFQVQMNDFHLHWAGMRGLNVTDIRAMPLHINLPNAR